MDFVSKTNSTIYREYLISIQKLESRHMNCNKIAYFNNNTRKTNTI